MRINSLCGRVAFNAVMNGGSNFAASAVRVFVLEDFSSSSDCYLGLIVSKKVGNAVVRNKCKRRLRLIFADLLHFLLCPGFAYVVLAQRRIKETDYASLLAQVSGAVARVY